ncbi:MAG: response regulator [Alphaproteobacteria bacterium]|nr:response regulator [Alphaproteobacteria bacterium]
MAHILLAEDDSSMRTFLAMALEKGGHRVTAKADGLEALRALDKNDAAYDLLLTDIVMPGVDGIELSDKARKKHPGLKVIFITGFAAVAMEDRHKPQESTRILSKPFHLNDLVGQIEKLLSA